MRQCHGCGAELSKRSQKLFCSNSCQRTTQQKRLTALWLEFGEAPWVDGRQSHYIRQYLAAAQSGRCAICGGPNEWLGIPLAFVLDHIDGDPTNNRRENLRLVCPNCDSQLPTFKARNRGNGRHYRRQRYASGQSF